MPDDSFTDVPDFRLPEFQGKPHRRMPWPAQIAIVVGLVLAVCLIFLVIDYARRRSEFGRGPSVPDTRINVKLDHVTDDHGGLHGHVHNGSDTAISVLILEVETKEWKREYEVKAAATPKTTAIFRIETGARAELVSFSVRSAK